MVEVLKAMTQPHAPLSQAQTLKVFQYLEEMNKDAMRQFQDFKRSVELSIGGQGSSKLDLKTLDAQVTTLQQENVKTNNRISALRVNVLSNTASVATLQEQATKANDNFGQIREGQKVTNSNVHNLREDHLAAKEALWKLQKEISSLQEHKENILQAKLDQALLAMQQCMQDLEHNKMLTYQNQDASRNLHESLEQAQADVKKLRDADVGRDKRMAELSFKCDGVKENLEMTNGVVMRLHTEHEETRFKAITITNKSHEIDVAVRRSTADHGQTVLSVQVVKEELAKVMAAQCATRDKLSEATERVGELGNGTVNLQNAMHELSLNVEYVHNLAANTEDNLKVTNALVLPNLGAEGALSPGMNSAFTSAGAKSMHSTRGDISSELGSNRGGSSRGKPSPRRRKEAVWFARNIGSVPDRMAWI